MRLPALSTLTVALRCWLEQQEQDYDDDDQSPKSDSVIHVHPLDRVIPVVPEMQS